MKTRVIPSRGATRNLQIIASKCRSFAALGMTCEGPGMTAQVQGRFPWLAVAALAAASACADARSGVTVTNVVAPAPVVATSLTESTMAVYATITNHGPAADTLTSVETDAARVATIHTTMDHGGMSMMMLAEHVVIPEDSTVRLAPGGTHVMLESLNYAFKDGDSLMIAFIFRRAGPVPVVARVVPYDQLEQSIGTPTP